MPYHPRYYRHRPILECEYTPVSCRSDEKRLMDLETRVAELESKLAELETKPNLAARSWTQRWFRDLVGSMKFPFGIGVQEAESENEEGTRAQK